MLSIFGYQDFFVYDILFLCDSVNKNLWYLFNMNVVTSYYHLYIENTRREGLHVPVVISWGLGEIRVELLPGHYFFLTNDNITWGIIRNMIARIRTPFIYSTFQQFLSFLQWCLYNTLDYVRPCSSTLNAMKMENDMWNKSYM